MMEQIKQDLKQAQQLVKEAGDAPESDKLTRIYYSCHVWGLNKIIDTLDLVRYIKRYLHQRHK